MKNIVFSFKNVALSLGLLASSTAVQAQSRVSFGPKAGVNFATYTGNDQVQWNTGLNGGFFLTYSSVNHLGVSTELLYTQKGEEIERSGESDQQINLSYVELPVLLRYFFGEGRVRPTIYAGPYAAYNLRAKQVDQTTDQVRDVRDDVRPFDFGVQVGVGANVRVTNGRWVNLDARYSQGVSRVYDVQPGNDLRNGVVSLNVGYAFGL
ncbi:MAG: porin family protein [Catalinimonas sp.]